MLHATTPGTLALTRGFYFSLAVLWWSPASAAPQPLPMQGEETENFLVSADRVKKEAIPIGITHPDLFTLTDGVVSARAIWKTVNIYRPGLTRFGGGKPELNFRDSYKHEIAAYELDKLLGLALVPAAVERSLNGRTGSLQIWAEDTITETKRKKLKMSIPDARRWNEQMFKIRLLHQLTYNTDRANASNILIDPEWRLWAIDHSRAFRVKGELMGTKDLARFSRSVLEKLRGLTEKILQQRVGRWLTDPQIDALLKRRDKILELAEQRIPETGEVAVLYP